jgi:hypothetical protein
MTPDQMIEALISPPLKKSVPACIGNDPLCPCKDGFTCHYKDGGDGTKAMEIPKE